MATFFKWLNDPSVNLSDKDAALYDNLKQVWDASACPNIATPDTQTEWSHFSRKMETAPTARRSFHPAYAFVIVAAIMVAAFLNWDFKAESGDYATPIAQTMTLTLPDASTVQLSAQSNLAYEEDFNRKNRNVSLQGEAFFSVRSGDMPFIVQTQLGQVKVVGTRFNVHSRNNLVEVSVVEGIVEVTANLKEGQRKVVLYAGEQVSYTNSSEMEDVQKKEGYSGWLDDGRLDLEAAPASRVCAEIERRFNAPVRLTNPEWGETLVSGLFENDPESMVNSLCVMLGRSYILENGVYVIR